MDKEILIDGMMGLVVGDACGVPVEFNSREELMKNPVVNMRGYGSYNQPKGTWSDDSSMALATLASLRKGYDLRDIAEQFSRWYGEEIYTPFGVIFDIGMTCEQAIRRFKNFGDPYTCGCYGEQDNGNGSLMRILPICLYAYDKVYSGRITEDRAVEMVHEVSALTHGHLRSKMACGLYYFCVKAILNYKSNMTILQCLQSGFDEGFAFYRQESMNLLEISRYERLMDMTVFKDADESSIKASGYVLDAFEAAIWSILNTNDYKDCILKAVNLGEDTDTVGAIAGGLVGLYYGYKMIPEDWRNCIVRKEWILELCDLGINKAPIYEGSVVDNHSHLMPGIDDGADSMEMTINMLRVAEQEGVTDLFLTSHGENVCEKPKEYEVVFQNVISEAANQGIQIHLLKGCEVFCNLTTWDLDKEHDEINLIIHGLNKKMYPTYNNTKYVLVEFNIDVQSDQAFYIVKKIQKACYIPVLAHVERYPFLIKEYFVEDLVEIGCLVQINAYSLVEEKNDVYKKNARYLLGKKLVHFLGSDAHRSNHRPPKMKSGVQYVWETCDKEYAKDVIYRNSNKYFIKNISIYDL